MRVVLDEDMLKGDPLNFHPLRNDKTTAIAAEDLLRFLRDTGHEPIVAALPGAHTVSPIQKVSSLGPRVLTGRFVALEPLHDKHREGIRAAANDAGIFRYMPLAADGENFAEWWDDTVHEHTTGARMVFVVRRLADGAIVGSTSYGNIVPAQARVEIGWTWYAPRHRAPG